jgi:hypothetical protein
VICELQRIVQNVAMRILTATILLLLTSSCLWPREKRQTQFTEEEPFASVVILPKGAVKELLRTVDRYDLKCLKQSKTLPSTWFEAANAELGFGSNGLLVVKAKNRCIQAADAGMFWLVIPRADGYVVALKDSGNVLEIMPTVHNGTNDVTIYASTAETVYERLYRFNGSKYTLVSQNEIANK